MENLQEIINGCKKASITHQKALYSLYSKIIYNISLKYCKNPTDAEDNLHDTFIEAFTNIESFKNKGSFEGWLKRIAINKAISKYKYSFNFKDLDNLIYPIAETEIQLNDQQINLDQLLSLIQELPNQYRIVFNLYELDEYSHKEIAVILNITEGTSKSNLFKAKSILKSKIIQITSKENIKYGL